MVRSQALVLMGLVLLPGLVLAEGERVAEVYNQDFYGGITVTSNRYANGNLIAYVSEKEALGTSSTVAELAFDLSAATGAWTVWGSGSTPMVQQTFDYSNRADAPGLEEILRSHNVKTIALSALLLWEDHLAEVNPAQASEAVTGCTACEPHYNGCSPPWWTSQECNGVDLRSICNHHDDCYQCGAICSGRTRSQCDTQFRQEIFQATANHWCATVYWLGVRAFGWLFYQDPHNRPPLLPDVYSLGFAMTACPAGLYHLCTIYLF